MQHMRFGRLVAVRLVTADRAALAFAAVVILLAAASGDDTQSGATQRSLDGGAALLFAILGILLLASIRWPASVALTVLGVAFVWFAVGYSSGLMNVVTLIAFFRLGVTEGQGRKIMITAVAIAALLIGMIGVGQESFQSGLRASGYVVMAVLFGELIRNRRLLVDYFTQRAERAEAEAERRIAEERLGIARDIHDVLAHTVSVMSVQAEVAADALERDQQAVRGAVQAIRHAGREAAAEVRATVAVLRAGGDSTGISPAPRIEGVPELVSAAREKGVEIELDVELSGRGLPDVVEMTAFRVVQEAITNVLRHADASWARVAISEQGSAVIVEVRDDGSPSPGAITVGFGLRGMAERVEAIGGQLWHGRGPEGGWIVRASLPVDGAVR